MKSSMMVPNDPFGVTFKINVSLLKEWGEKAAVYFSDKAAAASKEEAERQTAGKSPLAGNGGLPASAWFKMIVVKVRSLLIGLGCCEEEVLEVPYGLVVLLSNPSAYDELTASGWVV